MPIVQKSRKGEIVFDQDEHVRLDATMDNFTGLKPVFQPEGGSVTAGNASGLNDGAAAVLLMCAEEARQRGLKPLAKLVSWGHAGVDPAFMGHWPSTGKLTGAGARPLLSAGLGCD